MYFNKNSSIAQPIMDCDTELFAQCDTCNTSWKDSADIIGGAIGGIAGSFGGSLFGTNVVDNFYE